MTGTRNSVPSYKSPPIIEAVWSVQFAEMTWMLPPHTGVFWSLIQKEFPTFEEQTPIAHVVEKEDFSAPARSTAEMLSIPPLSRQWFTSESKGELIQLQRDRFCCNWRKVAATDVYPRYGRMKELFESAWGVFTGFVKDTGHDLPSIDQCEMTYINHIAQGQGWEEIREVGNVFPPLTWPDNPDFLPSPTTIGAILAFDVPELKGRLHASLKHGVRIGEQAPEQLLVLELTARGLPLNTDEPGLEGWFATAREAIVRGFTDLTSSDMHRLWEREQ